MNVLRYEPNNLYQQFHNEVNRFMHGGEAEASHAPLVNERGARLWAPAVDVKEEAERFLIHADVPGVDPNNIEITMDDGVLSIKGSRSVEAAEPGKAYARAERRYGEFERRFNLPDTADADAIAATSEHGVLSISIPKKAVAQPRRIVIQ